jgi:hypothetical protein
MTTISLVNGKFGAMINGKMIRRSDKKALEKLIQKNTTAEEVVVPCKFNINQRFSFVEKLVKMVATGVQSSAMITGRGGLGKSHTVIKTLEKCGYMNISDREEFTIMPGRKAFRIVKGYTTPRGLYKMLYENNNGVIVLDDCDSALRDPVAQNLLKSALDSYSERYITWSSDSRDDEVPRSFKFTGRVIFISNMTQDKVDQAIKSRSIMIDLSMTKSEIIDRMEFISKESEFMPEMPAQYKIDAIAFLREKMDMAKELSLRTLISIIKIRATNADWQDMSEYVLS